jgi:hypothetical protein
VGADGVLRCGKVGHSLAPLGGGERVPNGRVRG